MVTSLSPPYFVSSPAELILIGDIRDPCRHPVNEISSGVIRFREDRSEMEVEFATDTLYMVRRAWNRVTERLADARRPRKETYLYVYFIYIYIDI